VISISRRPLSVASFADMALFAAFCIASMLLAVSIQLGPYGVAPSSAWIYAFEFAMVTTAVGTMFGLFRNGERKTLAVVFTRALLALAVGVPVCYVLFGIGPRGESARTVLPYAALFTLSAVILVRPLFVTALSSSLGSRRTLIIGTGPEAAAVEELIREHGARGAMVIGFFPTPGHTLHQDGLAARAPIFPADLKLQAIVERFRVNEVIVAAREQRGGALPMDDLLECRVNGVSVCDVSGFYERVRGEVPVDSLKASWLIYGDGFEQSPLRRFIKRGFDVVAAITLLILALPVILLSMLAIALDDGLPILFSQERTGRGGRTFRILKLRTMRKDAEGDGVARWAAPLDARVTRVGRLLRKLRIDELPQLINVLNGDMSLVGPRPERPMFVDQLRDKVRFYDVRHSVKPGLTGWAQIRYPYGSSIEDAQRKLQFDLFYVKNNSLVLDVLILAETVRVVLFGEGAQ